VEQVLLLDDVEAVLRGVQGRKSGRKQGDRYPPVRPDYRDRMTKLADTNQAGEMVVLYLAEVVGMPAKAIQDKKQEAGGPLSQSGSASSSPCLSVTHEPLAA
jgi:hypothetical protein